MLYRAQTQVSSQRWTSCPLAILHGSAVAAAARSPRAHTYLVLAMPSNTLQHWAWAALYAIPCATPCAVCRGSIQAPASQDTAGAYLLYYTQTTQSCLLRTHNAMLHCSAQLYYAGGACDRHALPCRVTSPDGGSGVAPCAPQVPALPRALHCPASSHLYCYAQQVTPQACFSASVPPLCQPLPTLPVPPLGRHCPPRPARPMTASPVLARPRGVLDTLH